METRLFDAVIVLPEKVVPGRQCQLEVYVGKQGQKALTTPHMKMLADQYDFKVSSQQFGARRFLRFVGFSCRAEDALLGSWTLAQFLNDVIGIDVDIELAPH